MKNALLIAPLIAALLTVPTSGADTSGMLGKVAGQAPALAVLRYKVERDSQSATVTGTAICIAPKGVFLTLAIDARIPVETMKEFKLVIPGANGKTIDARFMGTDLLTGLGFVQAVGGQDFPVVRFSSGSGISLGQQVASLGIDSKDPAYPVSLGAGFVSSVLHVPQVVVRVTAGSLGGPGSVVLNTEGKAIGMVMSQPFGKYQMQIYTARGPTKSTMVGLRNLQEASYFTPVAEFAHVIKNMPSDGKSRRPSWIGISKFEAIEKETADIMKLDRPGVMIDKVIEKQPSAKAGLKNRDVILAMNGKALAGMATPNLVMQKFAREVMMLPLGRDISLTVLRGKDTLKFSLAPVPMPTLPGEATRLNVQDMGFLVREKVMLDRYLDPDATAEFEGLLVLQVAQGSPAADADLRVGDLLTTADGEKVTKVPRLRDIIKSAIDKKPPQAVTFVIRRGNQAKTVTIQPRKRQ